MHLMNTRTLLMRTHLVMRRNWITKIQMASRISTSLILVFSNIASSLRTCFRRNLFQRCTPFRLWQYHRTQRGPSLLQKGMRMSHMWKCTQCKLKSSHLRRRLVEEKTNTLRLRKSNRIPTDKPALSATLMTGYSGSESLEGSPGPLLRLRPLRLKLTRLLALTTAPWWTKNS